MECKTAGTAAGITPHPVPATGRRSAIADRRRLAPGGWLGGLCALLLATGAAADPLPSWRDGPLKDRILGFIAGVSTPGTSDYLTPAARIAVFDDEGTLWPEKPRVQGMFALRRLKAQGPSRPEWREQLPFRAALELGSKYLTVASDEALQELLVATHAGLTQEEFRTEARNFLADARHPRYAQPYPRLAYQPMRELVGHLRANGFRVFVVTAGSVDLVRLLAEEAFGIPGDDVIGSSVFTRVEEVDGRLVLRRLDRPHALNDGSIKPITIDLTVGRRPVFAVGNIGSGGDVDMLRYSQGQPARTLQLLVSHDDFEREFAYDEPARLSLTAAERRGWAVVSMRYGWKRLFAFDLEEAPPPEDPPPS